MTSKTNNSFDEIRFILAFFVLIAHTSILASSEQLNWFTRFFDSDFAVKCFFSISGYLVTKSYLSSDNFMDYFKKRIRRIYPAYILVIFYCIFVGALTTNYQLYDFFYSPLFAKYIFANLSFLNFFQLNLPGSIYNNPIQALNGSLWTIKIELLLYLLVPSIYFLYRKIGAKIVIFLSILIGISWFIYFTEYNHHYLNTSISKQFPGQLPFFTIGSMLGFIKINKQNTIFIIILLLLYYLLIHKNINQPYQELFSMFVYPLFIILVSKNNYMSFNIRRFGDLSYGIYLFHFPTIQLIEHYGFYKNNAYYGFTLSILLTLFLAAISWNLVEKKFFKKTPYYLDKNN